MLPPELDELTPLVYSCAGLGASEYMENFRATDFDGGDFKA
jgi:hypothetical protein